MKVTGETYLESDHVWLLVDVGGKRVAMDWGTLQFDRQHYEGYKIGYEDLVFFVAQDRKDSGAMPAESSP